jgi:hypothetical protein
MVFRNAVLSFICVGPRTTSSMSQVISVEPLLISQKRRKDFINNFGRLFSPFRGG